MYIKSYIIHLLKNHYVQPKYIQLFFVNCISINLEKMLEEPPKACKVKLEYKLGEQQRYLSKICKFTLGQTVATNSTYNLLKHLNNTSFNYSP